MTLWVRDEMTLRLKIISGRNVGSSFALEGELFIGRDSSNDIRVPDETCSRHHARIIEVGGRVVVKDLGSHNGIFLNGQRITEAVLKPGERLTIGDTVFILEEAISREPLRRNW